MSEDLITRLRSFDIGAMRTHYADCWQSHRACATHRAADEIERLREQLQDARMHAEQDACEIERLRAELAAERALADQLANSLANWVEGHDVNDGALVAWDEARRAQ